MTDYQIDSFEYVRCKYYFSCQEHTNFTHRNRLLKEIDKMT